MAVGNSTMPAKISDSVCHREERSDVAISKVDSFLEIAAHPKGARNDAKINSLSSLLTISGCRPLLAMTKKVYNYGSKAINKETAMRLSVNVDHFATLRQARRATEPEPVLAALLAEQAGASGITAHLRSDRRHINERDLRTIREVIKTKLTLEMAATDEMIKVALEIRPETVCLVPERPEELTTTGGLDAVAQRKPLAAAIKELEKGKIRPCIFVDPNLKQIEACGGLGIPQIEIHTGIYADLRPGKARDKALSDVVKAVEFAHKLGIEVTAGHGLDYHNVKPIVAIPEITELSIGFSIVARAAIVGISRAVRQMVVLLR